MGCGFERSGAPGAMPWSHRGFNGDDPKTCVGYLRRLPEVHEIVRARVHWEKGTIEAFAGGPVDETPLALVEVFDGAVHELERWMTTPAEKGGGAEG